MIETGYDASFVVLDRDVFTVVPDEIGRTRIDQTWIEGELAFDRTDAG